MMMRIEGKTDRLGGHLLDLRQHLLRTGRKIAVDHQHIILQHDPPIVAVSVSLQIALVKVNSRGQIGHLLHAGTAPIRNRQSANKEQNGAEEWRTLHERNTKSG